MSMLFHLMYAWSKVNQLLLIVLQILCLPLRLLGNHLDLILDPFYLPLAPLDAFLSTLQFTFVAFILALIGFFLVLCISPYFVSLLNLLLGLFQILLSVNFVIGLLHWLAILGEAHQTTTGLIASASHVARDINNLTSQGDYFVLLP
jgi:hypothetical protein